MAIFKDIYAVIDGARKDAEDVHEQTPSGNLKEESVADGADLTTLLEQRLRHEVVSIDRECTMVRDEQSWAHIWNLVETLVIFFF